MKRTFFAALMLTGALALAACGGGQPEPAATPTPATPTPAPAATPTPTPAAQDPVEEANGLVQGTNTTIIIYSNSFTDERLEWLTSRAAEDNFSIQGVTAGGADTHARLLAERHNPIADVVFGLNAFFWESLIENEAIIPYIPAWAGEITPGLSHPHGYYHALVIQAILLAYDLNQMSPEEAPTDWLDLWMNPDFHGIYEYESALGGGTTRMVLAGILYRFRDDNGHLGIAEEGWEHIRQYYIHGVPSVAGVDQFANIADPNSPVQLAQIWHSGIPMREEQHGVNTGFVVPSVGVPFVVEGIAVINGANNEEEAKLFKEWFGSAQIQSEWAAMFDSLPANVNALEDIGEFNRMISALPVQNIDWEFVAQYIDAWAEHIMLNYMR
ncbi:MAG: extracellular solute-binding protein [Defluviitaleaceae bacterium]|nr:extracellular solute-binding protein [Defluviitaleaceae bacterium]